MLPQLEGERWSKEQDDDTRRPQPWIWLYIRLEHRPLRCVIKLKIRNTQSNSSAQIQPLLGTEDNTQKWVRLTSTQYFIRCSPRCSPLSHYSGSNFTHKIKENWQETPLQESICSAAVFRKTVYIPILKTFKEDLSTCIDEASVLLSCYKQLKKWRCHFVC